MDNKLYFPKYEDFPLNKEKIVRWYNNLYFEISKGGYSKQEIDLLNDKNYYGKFLQKSTQKFFLHHFAENLSNTINFLFFKRSPKLRFLEIGCGCGNQLLLAAFLGAETIGCDIRKDVCDFIIKRKLFYENQSNKELAVSSICSDVFKINWDKQARFDAINFLFSFSFLRPNQKILQIVSNLLKPGGKLVIQDFNVGNYFNRIFRNSDTKKSLTPPEIKLFLEDQGFRLHLLKGGYTIPPMLCKILPYQLTSSMEKFLCRAYKFSPSYHLMAEKL